MIQKQSFDKVFHLTLVDSISPFSMTSSEAAIVNFKASQNIICSPEINKDFKHYKNVLIFKTI